MSTFIEIGGGVRIELEKLRTSHLLTQGASGSGKSYLLRVLVEQLCEHVQTIIIDPEGEFNTLREKFPFVLVGEGGETPAAVPTAELLARRLVEIGAPDSPAKLGGTAKKVAGILAGIYPKGIKRGILAAMCGVVDGGSFSARLSEVRSGGNLREENGLLFATPAGAAQYRGTFTPPRTTREVLDLWRPKLGRIPFAVLELLVHKRGLPVTRATAAASVGVVDGGSFSARLSELRSTGLMVDVDRGSIAANKEALFL